MDNIIENIKCPYCDKTFKTFNGLSKHKKYYGEITHKSDWEKHIEQMLTDDWESNEKKFVL